MPVRARPVQRRIGTPTPRSKSVGYSYSHFGYFHLVESRKHPHPLRYSLCLLYSKDNGLCQTFDMAEKLFVSTSIRHRRKATGSEARPGSWRVGLAKRDSSSGPKRGDTADYVQARHPGHDAELIGPELATGNSRSKFLAQPAATARVRTLESICRCSSRRAS